MEVSFQKKSALDTLLNSLKSAKKFFLVNILVVLGAET